MIEPRSVLKIDEKDLDLYFQLEPSDICYYMFEYIAGRDYKAGPGNDLISNLKKPESDKRSKPQAYKYKESAIKKVADLLVANFDVHVASEYIFVPIPPSKVESDPEYDDRLFHILTLFAKQLYEKHGAIVDVRKMLIQTQSYDAAHKREDRPKLEFYEDIYQVREEKTTLPKNIILFDDVLTTGTHFKAAKNVLKQHYIKKYKYNINILGLFIAKRIIDGSTYGFFPVENEKSQ